MSDFEEKNVGTKSETQEKEPEDLDLEETDPEKIFLAKVIKCHDLTTVSDACHVLFETLQKMERFNGNCRKLQEHDEKNWSLFAMALIFSFFSAMYVNCDIPDSEKLKRIKEATDAFADKITVEKVEIDNEDNDDNDNDCKA